MLQLSQWLQKRLLQAAPMSHNVIAGELTLLYRQKHVLECKLRRMLQRNITYCSNPARQWLWKSRQRRLQRVCEYIESLKTPACFDDHLAFNHHSFSGIIDLTVDE